MTMDILKGLLLINGTDVFTAYGAYLVEEKKGDNKNYSALLKPPAAKSHTAVSFRERDGEKLPDSLLPAWEARDVTLQFAIMAADRAQFLSRYSSFLKFLKKGDKGWLNINPPELGRTYRMYYKDCTDYTQLTDFGGEVIAKFSVKFREPVPTL